MCKRYDIRQQTTDGGKTWWWYVYELDEDGNIYFCPAYFKKRLDAVDFVEGNSELFPSEVG